MSIPENSVIIDEKWISITVSIDGITHTTPMTSCRQLRSTHQTLDAINSKEVTARTKPQQRKRIYNPLDYRTGRWENQHSACSAMIWLRRRKWTAEKIDHPSRHLFNRYWNRNNKSKQQLLIPYEKHRSTENRASITHYHMQRHHRLNASYPTFLQS